MCVAARLSGWDTWTSDAAFSRRTPPVVEVVRQKTGLGYAEARTLLAKFRLGAKEVERPCSSLTPGEQTRAYMAMFQANQVGVLILDEPTNHLDVEGVEQLELALCDYSGGLVVVSHDEAFCDALHFTRVINLPHTAKHPRCT